MKKKNWKPISVLFCFNQTKLIKLKPNLKITAAKIHSNLVNFEKSKNQTNRKRGCDEISFKTVSLNEAF
jgi:hypothetical protein